MVTKDLLRQVIYEQHALNEPLGVKRKIVQEQVYAPEVLVISGVRRCGKSVLLQQIRAEQTEQDYCLCFDDDRLLHFEVSDFQLMCDVFAEDFGIQKTFYLDEVQLIEGWEHFVDRLYSHHNKVFITGSNAHLLSKELGTLLTGRHLTQELWPMSLTEFMELRNETWQKEDLYTTAGKAKLVNLQNAYLREGGFPQYLQTKNPRYLKELYNDIIYRDIVARHKLSSDRQIREMAYYLASNFTHRFTYLSVAKATGIKSSETVQDYIRYLEEAYLLRILPRFSYKSIDRQTSRKCYAIDTAFVDDHEDALLTENLGWRLENIVAIELMRRMQYESEQLYYIKQPKSFEVDFALTDRNRVTELVQVTYVFRNPSKRLYNREIGGLLKGSTLTKCNNLTLIMMYGETKDVVVEGKTVHCIEACDWLLQK